MSFSFRSSSCLLQQHGDIYFTEFSTQAVCAPETPGGLRRREVIGPRNGFDSMLLDGIADQPFFWTIQTFRMETKVDVRDLSRNCMIWPAQVDCSVHSIYLPIINKLQPLLFCLILHFSCRQTSILFVEASNRFRGRKAKDIAQVGWLGPDWGAWWRRTRTRHDLNRRLSRMNLATATSTILVVDWQGVIWSWSSYCGEIGRGEAQDVVGRTAAATQRQLPWKPQQGPYHKN